MEFARRRRLYDPIAHALASTLAYEKSHFDKLVASLLPLMEKLTAGRTASLLSPGVPPRAASRPTLGGGGRGRPCNRAPPCSRDAP